MEPVVVLTKPVVFREKIRRPEPTGLSRERLERPLLDDDGPTVALVLAPAGSGKTTLLSQVAASPRRPAAWYRAGPDDGTEAALVRHLAHALSGVLPGDLPASTSVDALIAAVETTVRSPLQLIVDDVHEIAGTAAETALERFLDLRPRPLRVLLGSRRPPALNTSRLIVSGDLRELDGDDLRFRSWEVEELFRSVHKQPLSPEAAAALTRRTGGWAAGLQLFHLATMGKPDSERVRAVGELSGRSRLVRAYLARNVLAELPPDRRDFLLVTSTLGLLTGPLCDELLDRTGSAAILEDLERRQFFTTAADDGSSYRYHEVLQSHLEALLIDELGATASRELHARSGQLLEEAGHHREAMRAFALADNWASVARLVQRSGGSLPASGVEWPRLADDDPWLALARARRLLRSGSIAAAVSAYRRAAGLLDDPDFQARCADECAVATAWSAQPPAPRPATGDQTRDLATSLRQLTRRVPKDGVPAHPFAAGVAHLLAGRLDEAREALSDDGTEDDGPAGTGRWQPLCARLAIALADVADGNWSGAVVPLEEIALSADLDELPWLARLARGLQTAVLLTTRPEEWRADACGSLAEGCARSGDHWGALLITLFGGAAQLHAGHDEAAAESLGRAALAAAELDARVLKAWADTLATVAAARMRHPDTMTRIAAVRGAAPTAGVPGVTALLDHARGLLEQHEAPVPDPRTDSGLRMRCLGGFDLERDGRTVDCSSLRPRARSLLLLLAIHHGRDVHRERLIDALWPDAPPDAGTHRLQVAASAVRQCLATAGLGDHAVQRHADAYRLDLADAWVDLAEFEDRSDRARRAATRDDTETAVGQWSAALELYAGELLPEVGPAEWVLADRERLRLTAAEAARGVAGLSADTADAVRAAQRAIELDPLRDSSWLLLAELQERLGDPTAAAATMREHARVTAELSPAPLVPDGPRARV